MREQIGGGDAVRMVAGGTPFVPMQLRRTFRLPHVYSARLDFMSRELA
ncbi:MAG TPA: hypothetical protein VKA54_04355 [Gemmatimonadaceae bacterium]|nr:hypothetical protein [Gemmatimonadaceae bacterium]